jgi:hypothetical protein
VAESRQFGSKTGFLLAGFRQFTLQKSIGYEIFNLSNGLRLGIEVGEQTKFSQERLDDRPCVTNP